jgi:hypothetical protein
MRTHRRSRVLVGALTLALAFPAVAQAAPEGGFRAFLAQLWAAVHQLTVTEPTPAAPSTPGAGEGTPESGGSNQDAGPRIDPDG